MENLTYQSATNHMKKLFFTMIRYFELNFGWFFVNGMKKDTWYEHLNEKYNERSKN